MQTIIILTLFSIIVLLLVKISDKNKLIEAKNEKLADNFIEINKLKVKITNFTKNK